MDIALSFDLDWCSDQALSYVLEKLIPRRVPTTFFITHSTPLLEKIRTYEFFELGIHPNFSKGSTHGKSPQEIIQHCLHLVPEATSVRPHSLINFSNAVSEYVNQGIFHENSILAPLARRAHAIRWKVDGRNFLRTSIAWEDDFHFFARSNSESYEFSYLKNVELGVVSFHPIHILLNSSSIEPYQVYKLGRLDLDDVDRNSAGAEHMLDQILEQIESCAVRSFRMKDFTELFS